MWQGDAREAVKRSLMVLMLSTVIASTVVCVALG
jgi:hypothetical protein